MSSYFSIVLFYDRITKIHWHKTLYSPYTDQYPEVSTMDDLKKLMQEIDTFTEERDWDQFHSPVNLAKSIAIEAAELLECYQWNDNADPDAVEEELADVLNYCLQLASKLSMDPAEIIRKKIKKNALKYPVEKSKGRSDKYDQL